MTTVPEADDKQPQAYLPDFSAPATILVVVLVAELIAIALTITSYTPDNFLTELSKMSLYVLWLALPGTGLLTMIRPWAEKQGGWRAFVVCFVILELMCLALAEISWRTTIRFGEAVIIGDTHEYFMIRTFGASSIVIALAMRYLYVASEWRRSIVLEAQARISALHALIRPHFLFNSMNTIASLIRSDPRLAEKAVEDLADLLRANLNSQKNRSSLKQEFEIAAIYQRIEQLRLGDRLRVRWDIDELPMRAQIPNLTIQPLLENAIYHGIELLPEGGEVLVSGRVTGDNIELIIANPTAPNDKRKTGGNQMAFENIQQRYALAYGGRATVEVHEEADTYTVRIVVPKDSDDEMSL